MLLGTGLPTAAAYLLAAAVVAPALVRLGIEPIASHMFIFYFSNQSRDFTPPLLRHRLHQRHDGQGELVSHQPDRHSAITRRLHHPLRLRLPSGSA